MRISSEVLAAFWSELPKVASPRWARVFEGLSSAAQGRLMSSGLIDKERTIRMLGQGGSRIADLVVNPRHGLSVRKVPRIRDAGGSIEAALAKSKLQLEAESHLRDLAKGSGPFAHLKGGNPSRAYYDFAPGTQHPMVAEFGNLLSSIEPHHKAYMAKVRSPRRQEKVFELHKQYQNKVAPLEARKLELRRELGATRSLGAEGDAVLGQMRGKYPDLYDVRHANIVGGKLVDFEPATAIQSTDLTRPLRLPVDAASRRVFLGGKLDVGKVVP